MSASSGNFSAGDSGGPGAGPGTVIRLHYELSTEDEILESTEGQGPIEIRLGEGNMHPAIEGCLAGLRAGDTFSKRLDASLAFGERRSDLRLTLQRDQLPPRAQNLQVGDCFEGPGPDRKMHTFYVIRADDVSFTIDGNHPYAGYDLLFEGKVLEVTS